MRPASGPRLASELWPSRSLGVAELDDGGRIVSAGPVLTDLAGGEAVGRPFAELVASPQRPAVDELLREAGRTWAGISVGMAPDEHGVPVDFELWVRRDGDGTLVVAEPDVHGAAALNEELLRLNDDLIAARREAARAADAERAARERAEATSQQLRNVQQIVDTTLAELPLDELFQELLARLCQAVRADAVEAWLLDESGGRLELRADRGLPESERTDRVFPATAGLAGQTLRARRPLQAALTSDAGVSQALTGAVASLVTVPLQSGERPLGVLMLGSAEAREFTPDEIEMLELAAQRIGTAIDRALAFERERDIAATLQDSLMPGAIPAVPGLTIAARYRPAGVGHRVGGDFYDVFELPDGRSVTVVGDVRGKGPEAAARTALVRFTVRALARREPSPAALLGELNRAMLEQSGKLRRHCSIVFAAFTPAEAGGAVRVELSSGGHPWPLLLRADGTVESIGGPGSLVGLMADVEHRDCAGELRSGDVFLFYTDGVTEARGSDGMYGDERLAALLADSQGLEPDALVDRVEQAAAGFSDGPLRDDIAVVAVKAR